MKIVSMIEALQSLRDGKIVRQGDKCVYKWVKFDEGSVILRKYKCDKKWLVGPIIIECEAFEDEWRIYEGTHPEYKFDPSTCSWDWVTLPGEEKEESLPGRGPARTEES